MNTKKSKTKFAELAAVAVMVAMGAGAVITPAQAQIQAIDTTEHEGGLQGGGGDTKTEGRIDEIRADILQWIQNGGALALNFENNMTVESYTEKMEKILI